MRVELGHIEYTKKIYEIKFNTVFYSSLLYPCFFDDL